MTKRLISILLCLTVILSVSTIYGMQSVSADVSDSSDALNISAPVLRLERASADGYVDVRDGKLNLIGKYNKNGSVTDYTFTKTAGIVGKSLRDFTIKFVYKTSANISWSRDMVALRASNSDDPNFNQSYIFAVIGNDQNLKSGKQAICFTKGNTNPNSSTAADKINGYKEMTVTANTEYNVEIRVSGNKLSAWFYKVSEEKSSEPTITYTDASSAYSSGDIAFGTRAWGYQVSDITITDDTSNSTVCENFYPQIYNSATFTPSTNIADNAGTGNVSASKSGYRISSYSHYYKNNQPITTNPLTVIRDDEEVEFQSFDMSLEYIANSDGTNKIWFNSTGNSSDSHYALVLPSDGTAALYQGGTLLADSDFEIAQNIVYAVEIDKTFNDINVYIYDAANTKPSYPAISYQITSAVSAGMIYFYTADGDFTVNKIELSVPKDQEMTDETPAFSTPRFERASSEGYVSVRDGKFTLIGRKSNSETIVYTKGITGKKLKDFTIKYLYNSSRANYERDMLLLRVGDSENPTAASSYTFSVLGGGQFVGENANDGICITKNTASPTKASAGDASAFYKIVKGNDYWVEVEAKGSTIKASIWPKDGTVEDGATVTYTDTERTKYNSGDIAFGCRCDGYTVSHITLTDDTTGYTVYNDYSPGIYDARTYSSTSSLSDRMSSGLIHSTSDGLRVSAFSPIDGAAHKVITNAFPIGISGKDYQNYSLSLNYTPISDSGSTKFLLNSPGDEAGAYVLTLPCGEKQITLSEDGSEILDKASMKLSVGVSYQIDIERTDLELKIWIYESGGDKPLKPIISYSDDNMLDFGQIYFYTEDAEALLSHISLNASNYAGEGEAESIDPSYTVYNDYSIRLERGKDSQGYVDIRDGKLMLAGKYTKDNGSVADIMSFTKGITGKSLNNFTVKYTYNTSLANYESDSFVFGIKDSDNANPAQGYSVSVVGACQYKIADTSKTQTQQKDGKTVTLYFDSDGNQITANQTGVCISKNISTPNKNTADASKDFIIEKGMNYNVEIKVANKHVSVWIYQSGTQRPKTPVIESDISGYTGGDIGFASRPNGCSITDITVTDDTSETKICESYVPKLYNYLSYDASDSSIGRLQKSGVVAVTENGLQLKSCSYFDGKCYPTKTNVLPYGNGNYIKNFDLSYVYTPTKVETNEDAVVFSSRENVNGKYYSITLNGITSGKNIVLAKGDGSSKKILAESTFKLRAGVSYQVRVNRKDNVINVYVYRIGSSMPDTPTLIYNDSDAIPSGDIYFKTSGDSDSLLSLIALRSNDSLAEVLPYYELDFENGLDSTCNFELGSYELAEENGNTYLRLTKNDVGDGSLGFSFGPSKMGNFTLNMNIRIRTLASVKWHWLSLRFHKNNTNDYEAQIFPKGCDFAINYSGLGYSNLTKKIGMSGPVNGSPNPNHDDAYGLHPDDEWHKVSIVADGYKYSMYIDGVLRVTANDPEQLLANGRFRLGGWGADYDVDNIRIYTETYFNLEDDLPRTGPVGVIFETDFEGDKANLDGFNIVYGNKEKTQILTDDDGNHFLRLWKTDKTEKDNNGHICVTFGPKNVRNYDLTFRIREKSGFNINFSFVAFGIHASESNPRWNTVWLDVAPRGCGFNVRDTSRKLGNNNIIWKSGINTTNSTTAYLPTDNRDYGLRPDGQWHDVQISVREYTYILKIDGREYINQSDPNKTFEKGLCSFSGMNVDYDIDDVLLTNYLTETPSASKKPSNVSADSKEDISYNPGNGINTGDGTWVAPDRYNEAKNNKQEESFEFNVKFVIIAAGCLVVGGAVVGVFFLKRKNKNST